MGWVVAENDADLEQQDHQVGVAMGRGQLGVLVNQGGNLPELPLGVGVFTINGGEWYAQSRSFHDEL